MSQQPYDILSDRIDALELSQKQNSKDILKCLANIPYIHPQVDTSFNDNILTIKADKTILNCTCLVYVLPVESIDGASYLKIKHSAIHQTILEIKKEALDGSLVDVGVGDIVSNRIAIFRINPINTNQIILINSTLVGDITVNHLHANTASFGSSPIVKEDGQEYKVISKKTLNELEQFIEKNYQKKLIFGKESAADYFKTHSVEPDTMYIQVIED